MKQDSDLRSLLNSGLAALTALALLTGLMTSGCVSSSKVTTSQGVGQQLLDLDKAYKDGIITQEQYDKLKKELIRRNQ
jgi:hypothetical protein